MSQNGKITQKELIEMLELATRNEAIARMIGWKEYRPSTEISALHAEKYPHVALKWFYVPNVGRYNTMEMRFNSDYNWLMGAVFEMRKYEHTHLKTPHTQLDRLGELWHYINGVSPYQLDLQILYRNVAEYCIELQKQISEQKLKL